jgi:hypothetical protein
MHLLIVQLALEPIIQMDYEPDSRTSRRLFIVVYWSPRRVSTRNVIPCTDVMGKEEEVSWLEILSSLYRNYRRRAPFPFCMMTQLSA